MGNVNLSAGTVVGLLAVLLSHAPPALGGAPAPAPALGADAPEVQVANLGPFRFENGEVVQDFKVSFVTRGRLSENKDNVILSIQHFGGDHGDNDFLTGPGMGLDTSKYFVVATDFLGNARVRHELTTGPTNSGLKMAFPRYTTRDWIKADYRLLTEHLGIERIVAAVGASIGGMNAYQLAVSHPDFVQAIIPIAGSPATNPRTKTVLRNIMNTIALDNGWFGGRYDENPATGLATALMHLVPWWLTEEWFAANVSTPEQRLGFEKFWNDIFSVQAPQDARDVYYQLDAWANFNLGDTPGFDGDTRAALASVKAKTLLIGAKGDLLVRLDEMELARDTIPNARLVEIESPAGHLMVVGADTQASEIMNREIARFLSEIE